MRSDPIQRAADGARDLYDVATWERRSALDGLSVAVHWLLRAGAQALVVLLAVVIVGAQFLLTALATLREPAIGAYIVLSVVPALGLAVYVWRADVTRREPLRLLVATFLLGFLLAGFAAVVNTLLEGLFGLIPVVGTVVFFYVVVGPVEETVKWLAVRLYAFRSDSFDAVIDGAVYGAVAGLGFATIENSIYITNQYFTALEAGAPLVLSETLRTAAVRTLAGPGHVIYSAFAGYYLGLAKFNPENRGPIVVKGLLVAAFIHATYNTLAGVAPGAIATLWGMSYGGGLIAFILVYDGVVGYFLYRKIARYRKTYRESGADGLGTDYDGPVEHTEFDPGPKADPVPERGVPANERDAGERPSGRSEDGRAGIPDDWWE